MCAHSTNLVYNNIHVIKFSTSDDAFRVLWLVHSISVISLYTLVWPYMVNDCTKRCYTKSFFTGKQNFSLNTCKAKSEKKLWKKKKRNFGWIPTFRSTRKGKKCFCDEPISVWPQGITQRLIFIKFFSILLWVSLFFSLVFRTSKFLELNEFNKTIIPIPLVRYETGYSHLGATRLIGSTNRFHVAVRLFSNRSQMTSKCGKNKKVAHKAIAECVTDVLTTFWRLL